jgi:hypothetical protein
MINLLHYARSTYLCGMKYEQWLKNPIRFVAMTGYTIERFSALLPVFSDHHNIYFTKHLQNGKPRKGGRAFVLYKNAPMPSCEERLVFILSFLKLNPVQEHHADTFDMQQKQCNEFIHTLKVVLDNALKSLEVMPVKTDKELQAILSSLPPEESRNLLHDCTEREIPRPQEDDKQTLTYSGKKKKHTVKNAVIINSVCLILFLGTTVRGTMSDKKTADTQYSIPQGFTLWQDLGYVGFKPKGVTIMQPLKNTKLKKLTANQKSINSSMASIRVRVEHAIGSVKRYRIVKDECRLRKNKFVESILHTCAALHNFRIKNQPFSYPSHSVVKPT